jgi:hypothetical protein
MATKSKLTQLETPSSIEERYKFAITRGLDLAKKILGKRGYDDFQRGSVGFFLQHKNHLKQIFEYYSRTDIQYAMYKYASGRKITHLRFFRPNYNKIANPDDVLPLTMNTLFEKGEYWPSLHGTITRYNPTGAKISDIVIEVDFKSNWKTCFDISRPIVEMLKNRGAVFKLKYSGHSSVHIIIPAEGLRHEGMQIDHVAFFNRLSTLVKKLLREPKYLDTSFHVYDHYLRLAYSINENTGLVSLPFDPKDFDNFDPISARPDRVMPIQNWWSIPKDASERMREFIGYVMKGQILTSSVATDLTADIWKPDQKQIKESRQKKRMLLLEFLPNEGFYDRMVRLGQEMIDLREFLLQEDRNSKIALRSLRHLHNSSQEFNINSIAARFGIDENDLKLLWRWELSESAINYYSREEVKQEIYALAEKRKIRVGNEDKLVFLLEPADILPLIIYAHLGSDRVQNDYPTFYYTNSRYERTGEIPISCDLKIEFHTKDEKNIIEASEPVISLLSGFKITFFILFDGVKGFSIIIPYESLPDEAKMASIRHEDILNRLTPHLKRTMRMPGAACTLIRDCNALSLMPYAIHPKTGLVCVPIHISELKSFSDIDAQLMNVQVDNDWWYIPDNAPIVMSNFFKQMSL